ncbi:MAG TPA: DUF423 domain-containing protein [Flavipsychrobacter sp.]|jgi:uncharacterized membrane protein YgdD (TMEM256/DUF423 family)|nr:DUF423 domain-containing protein [Flavipsychrobacter sp.]
MYKTALSFGGAFAGLGVILGAFGAHALKQVLTADQIQIFETGVRYQMYHAFALLVAGILFSSFPFPQIKLASLFFIIGIVLFSGSLYAMTLLKANGQVGLGGIGIVTPIGGLFFILGWLMLVLAVLKKS